MKTIQRWWQALTRKPAPPAPRLPHELVHYWINASSEYARARWMREQFERSGLRSQRVEAYTPTSLPPLRLPHRHAASALQLACLCSHLSALERGLADGHEAFAVMEDDIVLPVAVDYERLGASAPAAWEILQLYVVNAERVDAMYARSYRRGRLWERWKSKNHSTGAYVCSRAGARTLLSRFKREGAVDAASYRGLLLADDLIYRNASTYSLTYPIYIENAAFESTLGSLRGFHERSHAAIRRIWSQSGPPDFAVMGGPPVAAPAA